MTIKDCPFTIYNDMPLRLSYKLCPYNPGVFTKVVMETNFSSAVDRDLLLQFKPMFFGLGNHLGLFSHLSNEPEQQQWQVWQFHGQLLRVIWPQIGFCDRWSLATWDQSYSFWPRESFGTISQFPDEQWDVWQGSGQLHEVIWHNFTMVAM